MDLIICVRQNYLRLGFGENATDVFMSSWRPNKTANTCCENNIHRPKLADQITFLTFQKRHVYPLKFYSSVAFTWPILSNILTTINGI